MGHDFTPLDIYEERTAADYGGALAAAVQSRVSIRFFKRNANGTIDTQAFFRGGDGMNLRLWPERGAWCDIVTGDTGGVRRAAREWFGMAMPEFMERYGDSGFQVDPVIDLPPPVTSDDWSAFWERVDTPERRERAQKYLIGRGVVEPAYRCESGFTFVAADELELWPEPVREWLWEKQGFQTGAAFLSPLRSMLSNAITGVNIRTPKLKIHALHSRMITDGAPSVYGWGAGAMRADQVVLCEGMADQFMAESMFRNDTGVSVIGCVALNQFAPVLSMLAGSPTVRNVVIVYHLDKVDNLRIVEAARNASKALGLSSIGFDWGGVDEQYDTGCRAEANGFDLTDLVGRIGWKNARSVIAKDLGDS